MLPVLGLALSFSTAVAQTENEGAYDDSTADFIVTSPLDSAGAVSTLDPIVITATREPLTPGAVPNTVEVMDAEEIIELQGRTLPELLRETPSVMVQKTAHGQGSPFVRGFTGYRTLALIDGVRLNNSTFRDGPNQYWNTIDPYSLRSIELVKGQGSTLFGSDAIGGTLNALTARPRYAGSGSLAGGRTFGRYASAEDSYTGRVEATLSEAERYGLLLGFTGKSYGDLRSGGSEDNPNTGYDEWDGDAKFEYFLNPDTLLTVLHQQVHQEDAWRTHRTIFGRSFRGTTVGDEQQRSLDQDRYLTYIQLEGEAQGLIDHYLINVSHHRQDEEQFRVRRIGDGRRDLQGVEVDTYGTFAQFETESSLGAFTYGGSYYQDRVDSYLLNYHPDGSFRSRGIQGPVADDSRYHLAGAFVQDHIAVNDRLDLWLGGRVNYAQAEIGRAEDPENGRPVSFGDDWTNFTGSARFLYALTEDRALTMYGGVSQGFRAPNLSDLSRLDTARSNEIETASPGLDPEEYVSFEIGLRAQAGRASGSVAYYYTDIQDLIVGRRTGRVIDGNFEITKVNAGDGYVQGIEVEGQHDLTNQLSLFGWLAWQDGQVESHPTADASLREEPVSRLMPLTAEAGLRWQSLDGRFRLELLALGAADADRLTVRDRGDTQRIPPGGTPGYVIGVLRGGWDIQPGLTLTAGVENFTDEAYRVHGSGINGPGRNFIVGAEWKF